MNESLKVLVDVSKDPKTTYLNASGSRLDKLPPQFLRQFCENIEKTTSIVTLDLSHNDIGGMEEVYLNTLFNAIRKNKSIQALKLISTNLNMLSKANLTKLVKVIEENRSITEIRLDYNELDKHSAEIQRIYLFVERNKIQQELSALEVPLKETKTAPSFFEKNQSNGHLTNGNGHVAKKEVTCQKIAELKERLQETNGTLFQMNYDIGIPLVPK